MSKAELEASIRQLTEKENAHLQQVMEEARRHTVQKRVPGPNGYFPDPIPGELSGIYLLGEGTGYRSTEVFVAPQKFGDSTMTAVQFINSAMEKSQNTGMAHSTILQKFTTGAWLGATAKLKQMNYIRGNSTAFEAQVTTPDEWVTNNTIALTDYIIWFCKTFYIKQSKEKL